MVGEIGREQVVDLLAGAGVSSRSRSTGRGRIGHFPVLIPRASSRQNVPNWGVPSWDPRIT